MPSRRALTIATSLLIFAGLAALGFAMLQSLTPSDRAEWELQRFDTADIRPGTFRIAADQPISALANGYQWSLLIVRLRDGSVKVWKVPVKDGKVGMPDLHWWRPTFDCEHFGPLITNGLIDESKPMQCHDKPLPSDWWAENWRWDLDGKHLGAGPVDDMEPAAGVMDGWYFVYGKPAGK